MGLCVPRPGNQQRQHEAEHERQRDRAEGVNGADAVLVAHGDHGGAE